jgi:hypothetical protein
MFKTAINTKPQSPEPDHPLIFTVHLVYPINHDEMSVKREECHEQVIFGIDIGTTFCEYGLKM